MGERGGGESAKSYFRSNATRETGRQREREITKGKIFKVWCHKRRSGSRERDRCVHIERKKKEKSKRGWYWPQSLER